MLPPPPPPPLASLAQVEVFSLSFFLSFLPSYPQFSPLLSCSLSAPRGVDSFSERAFRIVCAKKEAACLLPNCLRGGLTVYSCLPVWVEGWMDGAEGFQQKQRRRRDPAKQKEAKICIHTYTCVLASCVGGRHQRCNEHTERRVAT
jgi:hypothetical protein